MFADLFATWQDGLVTLIALGAAVLVVVRTLGNWKDSKPGGSAPGCDHCAVKNEAMRQ